LVNEFLEQSADRFPDKAKLIWIKNGTWYLFTQEMILLISVPGTFFENSEKKGLRYQVPFFQ